MRVIPRIQKNPSLGSRDPEPTLNSLIYHRRVFGRVFSSCGDAVISSPVARGCFSQKEAMCSRLSVKPRQEEFRTSQYPMPCHLTNSFGLVGGRVGGSHIFSYPSYMHCRCIKLKHTPFPAVVARIPEIEAEDNFSRLNKPPYSDRTKMIERLDTLEARVLESTRRERKGNGHVKLHY